MNVISLLPKTDGYDRRHRVAEHGMNHIGFHQKGHGVTPCQNRDVYRGAATNISIRLYFREWARPGGTGDSYILKLLAFAGVE